MSIYEMPSSNIDKTIKAEPENEIIKKEKMEQRKKRIIALAKELSEAHIIYRFFGVNPDNYSKLKSEEEEFPGFATPIDELVQRFKDEGIKVVFGNDPESGNVFILPFLSNDIENDSIFPKHLKVDKDMDSRLKELNLVSRS